MEETFKHRLTIRLRPIVRRLVKRLFRVEVHGLEHYHAAGPGTLIVSNHVSYLDGFLLYLMLPEPIAFAINTDAANLRQFKPVLWFPVLFVLDPFNPLATKQVITALQNGTRVGIFPEGRLSANGGLMKIYDGPALIADRADATVLPVGVAGTEFSRMTRLAGRIRRRTFPKVTITVLPPRKLSIDPALKGGERRHLGGRQIEKWMREVAYFNAYRHESIPAAVIRAARLHGMGREILEDINREPMTYRQLIMKSAVLAELLKTRTSHRERVGVLLPNACGHVVTLLALMQIGRVPAIMNFSAGPRALREACETGEMVTVLTSRKFVDAAELGEAVAFLSESVDVVYLEDLRSSLTLRMKIVGLAASRFPSLITRRPSFPRDPERDAVLLFTSGSEAAAKGVLLSHANLLANRAQAKPLLGLTHADLVFSALPLFHAFGLLGGIMLPLFDGARIFLYPSPLHYRQIPEFCYMLNATVMFGTNTFLSGYARQAHPYDFNAMRVVVAGAEPLRQQTREDWMNRFGIRILEGYGATEASPVLAVNSLMQHKPGTVGEFLTQVSWRLQPVEGIEQGGRLHVKGPNIMQGYLFHGGSGKVHVPASDFGKGWWDTGDIVDIDADGFITILGRAKRFAKLGGEMVSLTRVEEIALDIWPESAHAALATRDARKGEQIVLVTSATGAERKAIADYVKTHGLSELLTPKKVVEVESVPMLASGKTDYLSVKRLLEGGT